MGLGSAGFSFGRLEAMEKEARSESGCLYQEGSGVSNPHSPICVQLSFT